MNSKKIDSKIILRLVATNIAGLKHVNKAKEKVSEPTMGGVAQAGELMQVYLLPLPPYHTDLIMGRHPASSIYLADSSVSREHLLIKVLGEELKVQDLGSKNGTFVNGQPVSPSQTMSVRAGDKLQLGNVTLRLEAVKINSEFLSNDLVGFERKTIVPLVKEFADATEITTNLSLSNFIDQNSTQTANLLQPDLQPRKVSGRNGPEQANITLEKSLGRGHILKRMVLLPWLYLLLITLAEVLTASSFLQLGLLIHAILLMGLLIHFAMGAPQGRLALALTLAPLIRLLSLSLPLNSFPQLAWYPMVAIPLFIATAQIVRQLKLSRQSLNFRVDTLYLQFIIAGTGLLLGFTEYNILRPAALFKDLSWSALLLSALILIIFTGFNEEIIFRGLLQAVARPLLKEGTLIYVALLFAVLHIGYLSILDLIFVFGVSLLFSWFVLQSGSILGVSLAHGLTNVMLFLIMPNLNVIQNSSWLNNSSLWLLLLGSFCAVASYSLIVLSYRKERKLS